MSGACCQINIHASGLECEFHTLCRTTMMPIGEPTNRTVWGLNEAIISTRRGLVGWMGPSRSQEREEECSLSAGQECITMRIAQMIVFLIAGKTILVELTTVSTALCTNCRTDRNHQRTRGKRMFGIDLRGEALALAQVGIPIP